MASFRDMAIRRPWVAWWPDLFGEVDMTHDNLMAGGVSSSNNSPEQDRANPRLQSQSGINQSLSEGTPREGAPVSPANNSTDVGEQSNG